MVRNAVDAAKALGIMLALVTCSPLTCSTLRTAKCRRDGKIRHPRRGNGSGWYLRVAAEFGAKALTICTVSDHIALTSRPLPLSVRPPSTT